MIIDEVKKEKVVFVYTTVSGREEARSIGLASVEEKLAVCADFWAISSIYPWENVIQDVDQYMLVLTTEKSLAEKLVNFVAGIHSYTVPVVAACDVGFMHAPYLFWVDKTLKDKANYLSTDDEKKIQEDIEADGYHPGKLK